MFDKIHFLENYENETIKQYHELKKYYKIYSQKKEEKQQEFYNKVYIQNKKTDEIFTIKKTLKNETQKYKQLISLKVKELNRITQENNLIPVFITLTNPSKFHPFVSVKNQKNTYKLNKNYDFNDLKNCVDESYKNINKIYRELYKNIKTEHKETKFTKIIEPHKSLVCHLHRLIFVKKENLESVKRKYLNILKKHNLKQCKIEILKKIKGSSYITKYILKNFNEDDLHSLNGYKKLHKIRMFTMSNLNLSSSIFKKLYFNNKELNKKIIEDIKNKKSKYSNLYQFYTENTQILLENIDENGEIKTKIINKNKDSLFKIYKKTQKEEIERKTKKLVFDRQIETYNKNFIYEENKKINEENDFKNKFKNKFQKKYFYEIVDEFLFLQTFEKVYVVNKYKILEDKERIFVNKIKKLVIKNKENKIFYDNERYKLVKVNIQKELQKNEELKKVC
ncbi:replication endonuclease [Aliarcobacter sp. ERUVET-7]|uniref:replication endonuclease n=1 Tax=Aliarcobacter sp. ERUVET-7 TaxID=3429683 RepID=UPI003D6A7D22